VYPHPELLLFLYLSFEKGVTICQTDEYVHISFFGWCSFFLFYGIKKMATDGGGGVLDGGARWFQARILVPGWNPNPDANLFSLIFVYKLSSTNSYNYTNYSTNSYNSYIFYTNYITDSYNNASAQREPRGQSPSRQGEAQAHLLPQPGRTRLPRR
jgi:hypothetical protein